MNRPLIATVLAAALSAAALSLRAAEPKAPQPPAPAVAERALAWRDLSGRTYGPDDLARVPATVFLFSSTQCPIAGRYGPRMAALARDYGAKKVAFFLVNANDDDTVAAWTKWAAGRGLTMPLVKDVKAQLADQLGATVTPEAVIVDGVGTVRYIGRLDDSADSTKVTRQDVRLALDALLAGQNVKNPRLRAFGCRIFRSEEAAAPTETARAKVTYARNVAPILNKNCVVCHRAGDVGPFPLATYAQAQPWAQAIASYTKRRLMPPWKAVPGHGDFVDSRWLSERELTTLAAWAQAGAPQGDPKQQQPAPKLPPAGGWALGAPDMVVTPVRDYHLEAEGRDVYRNFTLPIDFTQDRYVSAFDFKPGNRSIVHHIIAYIDMDGKTTAVKDNREVEPGWSVSGGGSGIANEEWGDGWAPGMTPRRLPAGVAVKIPRGAKLVLQVHYHKSGQPETDRSALALYWARETVTDVLRTRPLGNPFFVLKPGVADQQVRASLVMPRDVTLRAILPHMHMLGKEMRVTATLPDGTKQSLIWVKNWEFNWQMAYRYRQPVKLPAGTRLDLVATYDNTALNPNQPSNPPRLVRFGEETTDEMCFAFLSYTPDRSSAPAAQVSRRP